MIRIKHALVTVAVLAMVALCLLISANTVARELIRIGGPDIIIMIMVQELMTPAFLFPLAASMTALALIAIDVIANRFPAPLKRWTAVFAALIGPSNALVGLFDDASIAPRLLLVFVCPIYLVLGMFLDPVGFTVLTLPLMIPIVESFGMNLIWFGVVIVKLLEIGLITPPVGLNLFVLASVLEA